MIAGNIYQRPVTHVKAYFRPSLCLSRIQKCLYWFIHRKETQTKANPQDAHPPESLSSLPVEHVRFVSQLYRLSFGGTEETNLVDKAICDSFFVTQML